MKNYSVRPIVKEDLETILPWRNSEEVRKCMINQREVSMLEHVEWFKRESLNLDRKILIFQEDNVPKGFVQFLGLQSHSGTVEWGFYTDPSSGRGIGKYMGICALDFIFSRFAVEKVRGWVFDTNIRSKKYHLSLNFTEDPAEVYLNSGEDIDSEKMICFSLLRQRWTNRK